MAYMNICCKLEIVQKLADFYKTMYAGALVDEIIDLVGLQVGLWWKIINVGAKGKLPETQRVHALNVDVDSSHRWEAQKTISIFWKSNEE
jgi:hypothetical protein